MRQVARVKTWDLLPGRSFVAESDPCWSAPFVGTDVRQRDGIYGATPNRLCHMDGRLSQGRDIKKSSVLNPGPELAPSASQTGRSSAYDVAREHGLFQALPDAPATARTTPTLRLAGGELAR